MIPPPTPVPSVTITRLLWPLPPPCHISPSAATFASFPAFTGYPISFSSSSSTFSIPHPRFTHLRTVPSSLTGPGTPIPTPSTSSFASFLLSITSFIESAMSGRTFFPPSSVRVLISHLSSSSPSTVKSPIFTVVPPTSTPNTYLAMFFLLPHSPLFIVISRPAVIYCLSPPPLPFIIFCVTLL